MSEKTKKCCQLRIYPVKGEKNEKIYTFVILTLKIWPKLGRIFLRPLIFLFGPLWVLRLQIRPAGNTTASPLLVLFSLVGISWEAMGGGGAALHGRIFGRIQILEWISMGQEKNPLQLLRFFLNYKKTKIKALKPVSMKCIGRKKTKKITWLKNTKTSNFKWPVYKPTPNQFKRLFYSCSSAAKYFSELSEKSAESLQHWNATATCPGRYTLLPYSGINGKFPPLFWCGGERGGLNHLQLSFVRRYFLLVCK